MKMSLVSLINTRLKKIVNKMAFFFGVRILTKSDNSKNGLKPFMLEFFIRESTGILHIGGHTGQEAEYYNTLGKPVIWIEGNPQVFQELNRHVQTFGQIAIEALVAESDNLIVDFHLTSNNSESASIYPLSPLSSWRNLSNSGSIQLRTRRLDSILDELSTFDLNYWVIDVQGAELQVIRSSGRYLTQYCKFVLVEISTEEFYQGGSSWSEVSREMNSLGFINLWEPNSSHEEVLFANSNFSVTNLSK